MPKKGGKKKSKGANKGPVDKVVDAAKTVVQPGHETEDKVLYGDGKAEPVEEPQAPIESKSEETPAVAPVSDTKNDEKIEEKLEEPVKAAEPAQVDEPAKVDEEPVKAEAPKEAETPAAAVAQEPSVQDVVDKTQDSKAGKLGAVETAEDEGKATLPDSIVKETAPNADPYPSTTEFSAEESATSTAAATGAVAPTATLAERPKTSESIATPVGAAVATPAETEAAHTKRPYEKPIFSNEENLKPNKIPKTEEEVAADIKAQTGGTAFKAPEPAPKKAEEKAPVEPTLKATEGTSKASPDAVAAANAAISSSKADKNVAPAAAPAETEPKKPEPAVKRGEESQLAETPQETAAVSKQEPAKTEEPKASEPTTEQPEKKKGGFFSRLKRMFK